MKLTFFDPSLLVLQPWWLVLEKAKPVNGTFFSFTVIEKKTKISGKIGDPIVLLIFMKFFVTFINKSNKIQ